MAYISFQPQDYFNTKLYTGNGSTNAITGVGFQPDWVWIKHRGDTHDHNAYDAVRGVTKMITPNETYAESTVAASLTSFDSDGFTLGNVARSNASGGSLVSWNWRASNATAVSNTDGSITSTVSANTTSGFSIVKWNGQTGTVGHGLGAKPAFIVVKCLGIPNSWVGTHQGLGTNMNDNYIILNSNGAGGSTNWGGEPTSSVFYINSNVAENNDNIAYCFAEKTGFSKFSSYQGNSSTDGTFVYTGFKPAFLIQKRSDTTANWNLFDNKRSTAGGSNVIDDLFYVDANNAEVSHTSVDFLSNGFKFRTSDGALNTGANIYMAFAEEPLVSSNGVPAVAR